MQDSIISLSRLNHTTRTLAVYASQGGLPQPPRKTRFRMARLAFPSGTGYPPGPNERFQLISHPPFPGFTWRTPFEKIDRDDDARSHPTTLGHLLGRDSRAPTALRPVRQVGEAALRSFQL